jgi:hypothetical protein
MTRTFTIVALLLASAAVAQADGRPPRAGAYIEPVAITETQTGPRAPRAGGEAGVTVADTEMQAPRRPRAGGLAAVTATEVVEASVIGETALTHRRPRAGGATGVVLLAEDETLAGPRRARAGEGAADLDAGACGWKYCDRVTEFGIAAELPVY